MWNSLRSMAAILEMPQYVAYQKNAIYAFIKLSAKSHSFNILRTMDGLSCPTTSAFYQGHSLLGVAYIYRRWTLSYGGLQTVRVSYTVAVCDCVFLLYDFLHSRSLRLCLSSVRFLSSSVNTSKTYISDMPWPILTKLGTKYPCPLPNMTLGSKVT